MRVASSIGVLTFLGLFACTGGDPVETDTNGGSDADTDTDTDAGPPPQLLAAFEVPVTDEVGNENLDAARSWAIRGPTHTGAITSVDLYLRGAGATGDSLTVTLVADASGPLGASLGSTTLPSASFSDSTFSWATATFDPPVAVDGPFWIVLSVPTLSASTYTAIAWNTGTADQLAFTDGAWSIYSKTYEWPHRVYGTP